MAIPEQATMAEVESMVRVWMVKRALKLENGICRRAAQRLGIHRNTLSRIMAGAATTQCR